MEQLKAIFETKTGKALKGIAEVSVAGYATYLIIMNGNSSSNSEIAMQASIDQAAINIETDYKQFPINYHLNPNLPNYDELNSQRIEAETLRKNRINAAKAQARNELGWQTTLAAVNTKGSYLLGIIGVLSTAYLALRPFDIKYHKLFHDDQKPATTPPIPIPTQSEQPKELNTQNHEKIQDPRPFTQKLREGLTGKFKKEKAQKNSDPNDVKAPFKIFWNKGLEGIDLEVDKPKSN